MTEYFGLSTPQASLDIAKYTELAPHNLTYDRSSKTYVATADFRPLYKRSSARRYLAELFATKTGILEPGASFIGMPTEVEFSALAVARAGRQLTFGIASVGPATPNIAKAYGISHTTSHREYG